MNRPPPDKFRRQALRITGVAGIAAIAGCLTSLSRTDSCSDELDLSLQKATVTGISNEFSTPVDGLSHMTQTVVSEALDANSGESTSRGYYSPHPHTEYVVTGTDPHYYHVETTEDNRVETTGYEYSAEIDIDESSLSRTMKRSIRLLNYPPTTASHSSPLSRIPICLTHHTIRRSLLYSRTNTKTFRTSQYSCREVTSSIWSGTTRGCG